jgi:CRP-like cAMP-binding protein
MLYNELLVPVAYFGQGMYFGELALLNNKPRQASVICKEDCIFATLSK